METEIPTMDFSTLASDDFNPWDVPLSKAAILQLLSIEERIENYRDRLDKHITLMHRQRLKTLEAAGVPSREPGSVYEPQYDAAAGCKFEGFDRSGNILYSGNVWFRGECDSFSRQDCIPLPGELLAASEEAVKQHFAAAAEKERLALEAQRQEAERKAAEAKEASDRAQFEALKLRFGGARS